MNPLDALIESWRKDAEYVDEYERAYPFESVADAIVQLRVDLNLTQAELGARIGTTQSVIARAESGRHSFAIALLKRIGDAAEADVRVAFSPRASDFGSVTNLVNVRDARPSFPAVDRVEESPSYLDVLQLANRG